MASDELGDLTIRMEVDEEQIVRAQKRAAREAGDVMANSLRDRLAGALGQRLGRSGLPGAGVAGNAISVFGIPGTRQVSRRTQAAGRLAKSSFRAGQFGTAARAGALAAGGAAAALGPVGLLIAGVVAVGASVKIAVGALRRLNQRLDSLTARIATFSPEVAKSSATARVSAIKSAIRDAQVLGGALSARQRLQTDTKSRLRNVGRVFDYFKSVAGLGLAKAMNLVARAIEGVTNVLLGVRNWLTTLTARVLKGIASAIRVLPFGLGDGAAGALDGIGDSLLASVEALEKIQKQIKDATEKNDMTEINRMMLSGIDQMTGGAFAFPEPRPAGG